MLDVACSGAYYLACGCDGIIAQPSTVTGSIGTIMQTFSVAGTMEKIGVTAIAVKSGKMKPLQANSLSNTARVLIEIEDKLVIQVQIDQMQVVLDQFKNSSVDYEALADLKAIEGESDKH